MEEQIREIEIDPTLNVEIRVKGQIDQSWSEWFDGLTITYTEDGETILAGPVKDSAALYGLIARLRDLNLFLISINPKQEPENACSD